MVDGPSPAKRTRRHLLRSSMALAIGTLAGCTFDDSDNPTVTTPATPTANATEKGTTEEGTTERETTETPTKDSGPAEAVVDRIETAAVPLNTVDPSVPVERARAIDDAIGDADIVALGESTHGTREFFQLKHRLFRYLVENADFRIFALEANFAAALDLNEYVLHGTGDPKAALEGLGFWTWNVESMLALVEWCRSFNEGREPADKIRFYGVDVQTANDAARRLQSFLYDLDEEFPESVHEDLTMIAALALQRINAGDIQERLDRAEQTAADVEGRLIENESAYVEMTSRERYTLARKYVAIIDHVVERRRARVEGNSVAVSRLREIGLAETVQWVLDHEDVDGMVIAGHNAHLGYGSRHTAVDTLGDRLRDEHGEQFRTVGLEFGYGDFLAHSLSAGERRTFSVDEPRDRTVPGRCLDLTHDRFLLDFDAVDASTLDRWLEGVSSAHLIGAVWNEDEPQSQAFATLDVTYVYDGLVFVTESTPSVPVAEADDGTNGA